MQEQNGGRIPRAGLAIEERQPVDVDGAVRRAIHGCLHSPQGWTGPGVQAGPEPQRHAVAGGMLTGNVYHRS